MASIRKQPNGNWKAIIRRKGHKAKFKTFPKKVLAERWARQQEETLSLQAVTPSSERTLLSAVIERYIKEITPRKKAQRTEIGHLRIVSGKLGDVLLSDLSPELIVNYVDERLETVKSDTAIKELNKLSVVVDAAIALWGVDLPANPVRVAKTILKLTKTLTPGVARDRRLSRAELEVFRVSHIGPLVEFVIETAMRRGEIARMLPEHIEGNALIVSFTKNDKPKRVPLSVRAREILTGLDMQPGVFVWGRRPDTITQAFGRICAANNIVDLRFHDLKHEAVSRMFERGMSIEEVAAVTGNGWDSLRIYTNLSVDHLAAKL